MDNLPETKNISNLTKWFKSFTETSDSDSDALRINFAIKRDHTRRVIEEITSLGRELGLNEREMILAEIIALLHDAGRFEQYRSYGTFSDQKSEDHAELGLKIIENHNLLRDLDPDVSRLILCSVKYHNRPYLPPDETEKCLFWAKLLRDADKLDIWKVVTDYYHRGNAVRNVALELELPDTQGISPEVFASLMRREIVNMKDVRNINDIKLLQAGWIYDINYTPSFIQVKKRRYMGLLQEVLPETAEVQMIFDEIASFMGNHN